MIFCSAAMDHKLGHSVAIKRINQISSLLIARRTLRELRLLRHFQGHPNIISIRDLFIATNSPSFDELFIVEDLMDADLAYILASKYPLSDAHCKRFLYELLRGVKALHSANVIHRDLKPGNLLWKHEGELRICDFGLARGIGEVLDGSDLTLTNYVATRWYRPPEILLYRPTYGKPLDMWSVGCIFAEVLGRKVFLNGQSGFEQLQLILQKLGTPPDEVINAIPSAKSIAYLRRLPRYPTYPLSKRFPHASPEAIDLLGKMLTFDPAQRITVEEALAHPYLAELHHPDREPNLPSFDFSFDRQCVTLADIKTCILEEVNLYRQPRPATPLSLCMQGLQLAPHLSAIRPKLMPSYNYNNDNSCTNGNNNNNNQGQWELSGSNQSAPQNPNQVISQVKALPSLEALKAIWSKEPDHRYRSA